MASFLLRLKATAEEWALYLSRNHEEPQEQILTGLISLALGFAQGLCTAVIAGRWWLGESVVPTPLYSISLFVASTVVPFHFGEFYVATKYRPNVDKGVRSFMLIHSPAHLAAYCFSYAEFAVGVFLIPDKWKLLKMDGTVITIAAGLSFAAYAVRLVAMAQCGSNFSLEIEDEHRPEHVLVTHGIYKYLRHPSYFGWFWRAVVCQVVLMNPVSLVGFTGVSWYFFSRRIPYEESVLASEEFFGKKYEAYKKTSRIGIPFIR